MGKRGRGPAKEPETTKSLLPEQQDDLNNKTRKRWFIGVRKFLGADGISPTRDNHRIPDTLTDFDSMVNRYDLDFDQNDLLAFLKQFQLPGDIEERFVPSTIQLTDEERKIFSRRINGDVSEIVEDTFKLLKFKIRAYMDTVIAYVEGDKYPEYLNDIIEVLYSIESNGKKKLMPKFDIFAEKDLLDLKYRIKKIKTIQRVRDAIVKRLRKEGKHIGDSCPNEDKSITAELLNIDESINALETFTDYFLEKCKN